jgi:2-methylcitrate dehydratase
MNLAEKLAAYCANFPPRELPQEAVHEAKRRVIDSMGCAMGAYLAEPPKIAREIARAVSSDALGATVIGTAHQSSAELAAFANGTMFRYLDFNDTYLSKEPAHPSDNIAALLAIAEAFECSGQALIEAIVLSYEIQCRLCDAYSIRAKGWDHVTYGSFSTVAGCGHLLGFDESQFVHAFGLAATPNNAMRITRAGELSMWKGCAFANASRNGVFASLLAHLGMTGPGPIFEGEMAFFDQICRGERFDIEVLGGEGGESYMINRTYIKKYPAEYHSQSAIDAALEIVEEHGRPFRPDEIESVHIETFTASWEIIAKDPEKSRPKSRETADHSIQYITCAALVDGHIWMDSFEPERFTDETLLDVVARTTVVPYEPYDLLYPEKGIPNRITVTLADGTSYTKEAVAPRGHALNPMSDDEVVAKFRRMAEPMLREVQVDHVLEEMWDLENVDDLTELLQGFVV